MKRLPPLWLQIVIAMILGAAIGLPLNFLAEGGAVLPSAVSTIAGIGQWMGKIFLALLGMVVVPLIFSSLVTSVTGMGGEKGLGRLGTRTAFYYVITSLLAITVGLILVNLIRPGEGVDYEALMALAGGGGEAKSPVTPEILQHGDVWSVLADIVFRMIPSNVVGAASTNGRILAIIFFALLLGVAINKTGGQAAETFTRFFEAMAQVMTTLTHGILYVAPFGIFGQILSVTAGTGLAAVRGLSLYMLTVFLALVIHAGITLPLILKFLAGRSPLVYARQMGEALATAFSTASSAGTLPLTMRCAKENAKVPERVSSFTLPLGATVNMDGTALYEAVAVLFIAQMGGDLTLTQQIIVAFTALLASIGAAGIPHAGLVMMVIVLQAVGLPLDAVLLILAVDRVLDMCRTTVNVWSDSVGAALIARWEERAGASG